jgi:hypothetical protein
MDVSSQWFGRARSPANLNLGELFLSSHGSIAYLAMKAEADDNGQLREYVMLLGTLGGPDPDNDPFPRVLYSQHYFGSGELVRLIEGGQLVAEPTSLNANEALAPSTGHAPNGALGIFEDGTLAIFVNVQIRPRWFNLATGTPVTPLQNLRVDRWRLVWRFGDETMELFRFPST